MTPAFQRRNLTQLAVSTALVVPLVVAAYYAAYMLRFAGNVTPAALVVYIETVTWVVVIKCVTFAWFRLHQSWTRFVGFHDMLALGQAVTCAALGVTLFDAMCLPSVTIPRSVIVIDWGGMLLAAAAIRGLPRFVYQDARQFFSTSGGAVSLIVGANEAGEALLRAIRQRRSQSHRIIGFIDDRSALGGQRIGGVPVLGTCEELPRIAERFGVKELLIASGELHGKKVRELMELGQSLVFRVQVVPSYEQLLAGRVAVRPRKVAIEDLLCRDSVEIDLGAIHEWLAGRVIMVTGSAGSIGSEICRQLLNLNPAKLVLIDRSETGQFFLERELTRLVRDMRGPNAPIIDVRLSDLTDHNRLAALFQETRPEIIFHAAAYKHVPFMESHCGEAIKNIVVATRNLVELADEHEAQALVMISTDKAVNPTSVMGSCKRLAEQYVQARSAASTCRFVTVRFGNVLDSSGSVVPVFREQIARGGPVTVTHPDIVRYFMLIPEAAQLVIQAGAMGQGGEIFVLDMGEPVRIMDLAHDLIRLSGLRVGEDIEIEITGLRPGEKLYEELYDVAETHGRTTHPKIMVANSARRHLLEVIRDISWLESMLEEPNETLRASLREVIPIQRPAAAGRRAA
jgi:FlaA1/EpsC-like NDP-sugar epimerase